MKQRPIACLALFVFLILAALYESWRLPLSVILIVPLVLLFSVSGVRGMGMDINVMTQVGFIVLIGLACKNAILIVEFAKQRQERGEGVAEAVASAARNRLRPILMTSFAFILGVTPMVLARGTKLSIFDEPEAGIDLWSFQNLIRVFEKMYEQTRGSILIISHQERILNIADTIVVVKDGDIVRSGPRAELLLFEAARAQHVDQLIRPALESGKVVLCDRFADSSSAYQGAARNLGDDSVEMLNAFAVDGVLPDLTIVLDIPAKDGLARANKRDNDSPDRMGAEKLAFYEAVRGAFLKMAARNPDRFAVVDSSGSKEETFAKIIETVKAKFNVES